jgi:hypothetical protein
MLAALTTWFHLKVQLCCISNEIGLKFCRLLVKAFKENLSERRQAIKQTLF